MGSSVREERREISPDEAKDNFGIWTLHHEMEPNGERRFRLYKDDGTGYIRTESGDDVGKWQEGHSHKKIIETYIVQHGWIGFAELIDGSLKVQVLREGAIVTTKPGIKHNVYMSAGATIHTVKHGAGDGEDRESDENITLLTSSLTESDIATVARKSKAKDHATVPYDEEYRHFDNLIWKLPGWSTAVFLGTAAVLGQINAGKIQLLIPSIGSNTLVIGFLAIMFMFLLGISHVLFRFRRHQIPLKKYSSTPWYCSASTYLQLFVTIQAFSVCFIVLTVIGIPALQATLICALSIISFSILQECTLRKGGEPHNPDN